jgi:phosphopantetheinyl transferase
MPVFFEKDINAHSKLGVWSITEEEDFFLKKVAPQRDVTHINKRLQHLAGRYLLTHMFPEFPSSLIQIADTRKPYLANEEYHFSISHCGTYAAALVSKTNRVGVDIEMMTPKVQKIKHKFLSGEELNLVNRQWQKNIADIPVYDIPTEPLILLWSCKEAVFKWYGTGEVDFKEHMVVKEIKQTAKDIYQITICFQKNKPQLLLLQAQFLTMGTSHNITTNMALSYIVT